MPLVDLDDPEELRARWGALAAVAHATGFDRRWYADDSGWYHQDETGSDLRMVLLDGDRAVLFGFHTEHSRTGGSNVLVGAPDWIAHPEVRNRIDTGRLGFVYGSYAGTWARAAYPGDPWQPLDDGFHSIATWLTSDEDAAEALIHWAAAWADYPGDPDGLRPVGLGLIRQAATTGLTADALRDLFGRLGVDARSPRQPDVPAGLAAWAQFGGPVPEGSPADHYQLDDYQRDGYDDDDDEDEQQIIVPPGVSPFTGQLIADAEPGYIEPYGGYGTPRFVPADPSPEPVFVEPEPVDDEYELPALARLGLVAPDPVEDNFDDDDLDDEDPDDEVPAGDDLGEEDLVGEGSAGGESGGASGGEADAGDPAGAAEVAAEGPGEPPTVPRVGSEVGEGEDYYASLFADAPAATTYRPDMRRSPEADQAPVQSWEVAEPANGSGVPQDDLAVPFSSPSGDALGGRVPPTSPYDVGGRPDGTPAGSDDASFPEPSAGPVTLADAAGELASDALAGRPGASDEPSTADDPGVSPGLEIGPRAPGVADEEVLRRPGVTDYASSDDAGSSFVPEDDRSVSPFPDDDGGVTSVGDDHLGASPSPDDNRNVGSVADDHLGAGPFPDDNRYVGSVAGDHLGAKPFPDDSKGLGSVADDHLGVRSFPDDGGSVGSVAGDRLGVSPFPDLAAGNPPNDALPRRRDVNDAAPDDDAGFGPFSATEAVGGPEADDVLGRSAATDQRSWDDDAGVEHVRASGTAASDPAEDVLGRSDVLDDVPTGDARVDAVGASSAAAGDPTHEGLLRRSDVLGAGSLDDDTDIHPVLDFSDADDPAAGSSPGAPDVIDDVSWDEADVSVAEQRGSAASDPTQNAVVGRSDPLGNSDVLGNSAVLGGGSLDDDTDIHPVLDFSDAGEPATESTSGTDRDPLRDFANNGGLTEEPASPPDALDGVFSDADAVTGSFAQLEQIAEPSPARPARREWIGGAWINGVWVEDAAAYWAQREAAESAGTNQVQSATGTSDALSASGDALAAPGPQDALSAPASGDAVSEAGRADAVSEAGRGDALSEGARADGVSEAARADGESEGGRGQGLAGPPAGDAVSTGGDDQSWSERERRARAGWPGKARRRLRSDDSWAASGSTGGPGALPNFFAPESRTLDQPTTARTAGSAEGQQSIVGGEPSAGSDQQPQSGSTADDQQIENPGDRGWDAPDPKEWAESDPNQETSSANDEDHGTATSDDDVPDDSPTAELAVLSDEEIAAMRSEQGAAPGPFVGSDPDEEAHYAGSRSGTDMAPASDRVELPTPGDSAASAQPADPPQAEPLSADGLSADGLTADGVTADADPEIDARSGASTNWSVEAGATTESGTETDAGPADAESQPGAARSTGAEFPPENEPGTDVGLRMDGETVARARPRPQAQANAETNVGDTNDHSSPGTNVHADTDTIDGTDFTAGANTDADAGTGAVAEADAVGDAELDAVPDTDALAHVDAVAEADAVADTDALAEVDADAVADTDADAGAQADGEARSDGDADTGVGGGTGGDEVDVDGEARADVQGTAAADSGADEVYGLQPLNGRHDADEFYGPQQLNGRHDAEQAEYDGDQEHAAGFSGTGRFVDGQQFIELEAPADPGPFEQRELRSQPEPFQEDVLDTPEPVGERGPSIERGPADESESAAGTGRAAEPSEAVAGPVAEAEPADQQAHADEAEPDETAELAAAADAEPLELVALADAEPRDLVALADAEPAARDDDVRQPVRPDELVVPASTPAVPIPGLGLVGAAEPQAELAPGSLEAAMRAEQERPRARPAESAALQALHEWCRARTRIVPSGFTIQVQVLDPAAPSYRFDLEPPEVDDPEYAADRLRDLLGDLWLAEAESEQGGWLFARIDAAGRTLRIDRWYDQVPDWWDNPVEQRLDVPGLLRRLTGRGPEWQPTYLEKLSGLAR